MEEQNSLQKAEPRLPARPRPAFPYGGNKNDKAAGAGITRPF